MVCPFCSSAAFKETPYPRNRFNNKEFRYVRCKSCDLVYLVPFPDESDYMAMYPPAYQRSSVEQEIYADPYKKLYGLRFSYGYQFDLIRKQVTTDARILDYGCGTGNFIANAVHNGFVCDGAEFNPEFIRILKQGLPASNFYLIDEVLSREFSPRYDVIRMSNVLEHLVNPQTVLRKLSGKLKPGGIILIEGPIEDNFSIAELVRKTYFNFQRMINPGRVISDPPYHIFFSNAKNQRALFRDSGFTETHFAISEDSWPFPQSVKEANGFKNKIMAIVGKISISCKNLFGRSWGNIFVYTGKIN